MDESTAILPQGWRERLVKVETPQTMGAIGWCLEVHDLAVSKLAAAREKDFAFVQTMIRLQIVSSALIRERLEKTPEFAAELKVIAIARLDRW